MPGQASHASMPAPPQHRTATVPASSGERLAEPYNFSGRGPPERASSCKGSVTHQRPFRVRCQHASGLQACRGEGRWLAAAMAAEGLVGLCGGMHMAQQARQHVKSRMHIQPLTRVSW